ncbi:phytanoyl-CoA dioxygenase family protein [Parafilimonas terrae]|jgi:ectoine hydroxylase-related dioxygenase (phytanoyl-CoA dioxygenase family)|uniref:Phytanoyl-CoA dioxygenase (PhyH) n=1 Tax=Parafilimonas terrae TaxID=1465490 RepID=A0A1I5W992_9BACT|nr:phytanoyl-CoA dioxygenase family protein [Parafilimonas terrae]SFQ16273.1 Phytanoyl-CoA dioxygenase (PhyH) [Parafilimonas terrae]
MRKQLSTEGFVVIDNIYTLEEINSILETISQADTSKPTFRRTNDLFAIRQFLKEVPAAYNLIFNNKLNAIVSEFFGDDYFIVKSIYFNKPEQSNWFVAYHQDLTISVDKKLEVEGFGPWTVKQNQFAVQPPLDILEDNFTIRIHLDNTNEYNGALRVIPKSHLKRIYRPETIDWSKETEIVCDVALGGIMIMKPLLLHASNRTTSNNKRRVIHIEFSNRLLPGTLQWSEKKDFRQKLVHHKAKINNRNN